MNVTSEQDDYFQQIPIGRKTRFSKRNEAQKDNLFKLAQLQRSPLKLKCLRGMAATMLLFFP